MNFDFDSIVVGAGVVGLAIARSLAEKGREVLVLESDAGIGRGISSRNSEVIHAGIYYPFKSLKRRLCVEGRRLLVQYCDSHKIEHRQVGKLIIANEETDLDKLPEILRRGLGNGVQDLRMVFQDEIRELEPSLRAKQGILSPSTGIIDSHGFMLALRGDIERAGSILSFNSKVIEVSVLKTGFCIKVGGHEDFEVTCRELINSAGLDAPALSKSIKCLKHSSVPRPYYCKGSYFSLSRSSPFKRLIYPVPNNAGLGIHLTLDLAGRAKFGPDVEWIDEPNYTISCQRKHDDKHT